MSSNSPWGCSPPWWCHSRAARAWVWGLWWSSPATCRTSRRWCGFLGPPAASDAAPEQHKEPVRTGLDHQWTGSDTCVCASPWCVRLRRMRFWRWWRPSARRSVSRCSQTWHWCGSLLPRRNPSCRSERWWTPGRQVWTYRWPSSERRLQPEPDWTTQSVRIHTFSSIYISWHRPTGCQPSVLTDRTQCFSSQSHNLINSIRRFHT